MNPVDIHRRAARTVIVLALALSAALQSCGAGRERRVTVMTYNLMNLFDATDDGVEYPEYSVADGRWDARSYRLRLDSLAAAITAVAPGGPDVLAVQEAENAAVLEDLADALGGYRTVACSPDGETPVACGLISRLPVTGFRAHAVRTAAGSPGRRLLELDLDAGGKRLVVLVAHWKSKLGGAAETEPERRAAAALARAVIARRLSEDPALAIVLAGDLNENPDEYRLAGGAYPTALALAGDAAAGETGFADDPATRTDCLALSFDPAGARFGAGELVLFSPWGAGGYSYRYRDGEERIDHLLMSPSLAAGTGAWRFASFHADPPEFLVDEDGSPLGWDARTRSGWSDHLPTLIALEALP